MRTTLLLLALFAVGLGLSAQDQERPRMVGNPLYVSWIGSQPKFGPRGDLASFPVECEISQLELKVSGDIEVTSVAKISFDLLKGSDDDRRLAEMLEQRMLKEYRVTFPPALDDRRRAIRHP